ADLPKATRILTNLAVNAVKVTPQGRPLRLWAQPSESGDVRVGVTDEGPGLSPEELKIIFDRFQQVGEPQVAGTKGFGLGLSIVKQLTWFNLGKVEVQSEKGKGSTFAFTLPAFDPTRIIACYLENAGQVEKAADFWALHISYAGGTMDAPMLGRLI